MQQISLERQRRQEHNKPVQCQLSVHVQVAQKSGKPLHIKQEPEIGLISLFLSFEAERYHFRGCYFYDVTCFYYDGKIGVIYAMRLAAFLIALLLPYFGQAQQPTVFTFSVESLFEHEHMTSIAIDNRGLSYFAVTRGILEFDGVEWRRISVNNNAVISLLAVNDKGRIFAGGRGEFGYLAVDDKGNTIYSSLSSQLTTAFQGDIVAIIPVGDLVYYFAPQHVYVFQGDKLEDTAVKGNFLSAAAFRGRLYAMEETSGLVELKADGTSRTVPGSAAIRSRVLAAAGNERLLIISPSRGYFEGVPGPDSSLRVRPWSGSTNGLPGGNLISSVAVAQGVMAFATLGEGVIFTDFDGKITDRVMTRDGLYSNLSFGATFTPRNTLWVGHDNGVSLIEAHKRIAILTEPGALTPPADTLQRDTSTVVREEAPGFFHRAKQFVSGLFTTDSADSGGKKRLTAQDFSAIVRRVQFIANDSTVFGGAFSQERLGVQDFEQSDSVRYVFDDDENALRFSYATNQFENNGGIQYQVFLDGLDNDWSPWSENTFREYTNLNFGTYYFKVRARNSSGLISHEARFRFEIDPPWHQAVWFYLLQIAVYIGLLVTSYFLNKKGVALGLSDKIVTVLVVVSFQYIELYLGPLFEDIAGDIAIFAVGVNVLVAAVLDPIQERYAEFLKWYALRQKEREDRLHLEEMDRQQQAQKQLDSDQ
jgi:hypothetical protein